MVDETEGAGDGVGGVREDVEVGVEGVEGDLNVGWGRVGGVGHCGLRVKLMVGGV